MIRFPKECKCCPNPESRTLEVKEKLKIKYEPKEEEIPTDLEKPEEMPKKPIQEPEEEPKEKPEEKSEEDKKSKSPEELEYQRLTAEYEARKADLISRGFEEGVIDPKIDDPANYIVRILKNQDDEEVSFYKAKPTKIEKEPEEIEKPIEPTEPEVTPTDFELPIDTPPEEKPEEPETPEEPVTISELKRMIKNAIREVKIDLKNKKRK